MFNFWKKKQDPYTQKLNDFLGFEIKNINLYKEAFTHPSKKLNYNYQRLEFLGDAVLNYVVALYLFNKFEGISEGELSKLRTKLVNKQILKEIAIKLNIAQWIEHNLTITELDKSSVYCDVIESLIGAIAIDKGIQFAAKFIDEKIIQQVKEVSEIEDTDYKSQIIQIAQKYKWKFKFIVEGIEKQNSEKIFRIGLYLNNEKTSEGKHYNKKQAEQMASKEALKNLNILT
ncbi:MAG: ribonuclease III [Bacteroidia bacterium]|nr:ribonuclease III [Bacteroidia bacterium]